MNGGAAAPVRRNSFPRILAGLSLCANPDWLSTHHTAPSVDGLSLPKSFQFALEAHRRLAGGKTTGKPIVIAFAPRQGRGTGARSRAISSKFVTSGAPAGAQR